MNRYLLDTNILAFLASGDEDSVSSETSELSLLKIIKLFLFFIICSICFGCQSQQPVSEYSDKQLGSTIKNLTFIQFRCINENFKKVGNHYRGKRPNGEMIIFTPAIFESTLIMNIKPETKVDEISVYSTNFGKFNEINDSRDIKSFVKDLPIGSKELVKNDTLKVMLSQDEIYKFVRN